MNDVYDFGFGDNYFYNRAHQAFIARFSAAQTLKYQGSGLLAFHGFIIR
jgi:hypothetical protein